MSAKPHTVLRVRNLDVSLAFYRDQLGWTAERPEPDKPVVVCRPPLGRAVLLVADPELDVRPWVDPVFEELAPGRQVYVGGEALPSLRDQLAARGVTGLVLDQESRFGRTLLVPDPDGYIVHFFEELPVSDEVILRAYAEGPEQLEAALEGLSGSDLDLTRAPGKWSIRQTVLHMVDSDLGFLHRIKYALAEPGRTYVTNPYSQDTWAEATAYAERPIETEVRLFRLQREHVLGLCRHLPDAMSRTVIVGGRAVAVRDMLRMLAWHVEGHLQQIRETRRVHGK
jgi:catechol 2,3-dioxygenase-like lactoylglutathione lyase family enzyme